VDFEDYLISKRIDSASFKKAEPELWAEWNNEFEQMHPDSFTMQKLNLINPVRRKYRLLVIPQKKEDAEAPVPSELPPAGQEINPAAQLPAKPKPIMAKPVFKPKPKM
jgi:hypothetical protein